MKIEMKKLREWIEKKRKDDYWTKDDEYGNLERGKEICLDELEEFLGVFESNKTKEVVDE